MLDGERWGLVEHAPRRPREAIAEQLEEASLGQEGAKLGVREIGEPDLGEEIERRPDAGRIDGPGQTPGQIRRSAHLRRADRDLGIVTALDPEREALQGRPVEQPGVVFEAVVGDEPAKGGPG
jgi:hypothetical protein